MACKQMICVFNLKKQNKKKVPNFPLEEKKKAILKTKEKVDGERCLSPGPQMPLHLPRHMGFPLTLGQLQGLSIASAL